MGIVASQSFRNLITTYLGFGIGALNTLVLYVHFFKDEYYGLVGFLLSAATLAMPFVALGVQNTMIKFYSSYSGRKQDDFLSFMLVMPIVVLIPISIVVSIFYDQLVDFLASKNEIVRPYAFLIGIIAFAMAYFEISYAWSKTQLQSVFGNMMNEVFHRLGIMTLLILFAFELLTTEGFLYGVAVVYLLRMAIMMSYAFKLRRPRLRISIPKEWSSILKYSVLIIIAGSIAVMILEIDMFMLGKLVPIENVAYYSVGIYIAAVIAVPARAMHQIIYPLTANYLNERRFIELKDLYKKSSITLYAISGLIFLLIICNIQSLYLLLDPSYSKGLYVVFLISLAKLVDNLMGNNNAILYNSDYYRLVLVLGVILVAVAVSLNLIFIPKLGINGAAIATFMASVVYAFSKIVVVFKKFKMHPFTKQTLFLTGIVGILGLVFFFLDFEWHPIVSIGVKSVILSLAYLIIVYKFNISNEINNWLNQYLLRRKSRPE
ncbi:O-antigen/teichoic acid export membrane protein [Leeuwenhoekiella aestuarii]|uniref:O-antigen/teichoic acid export membrane protein n=1 Tax=Leeuwenhoekiella aestuarii TaxID=2249426 RepID=A0A4Q0NV65_9FLAO|nr:oligosaccharide flippase family protein [Leeuwenhoekiella aestuarii]RXG15454.1 O-antigen/teichoic acid export membrane protein [Leeuwenhoekiella aestuarii]RXG17439.1 O-antigen/teichoic acid export membrane protein [Leeuwenhoekiella aestuarii]